MIKSVIIAGDPYRGDQANNIRKIKGLFTPLLNELGVKTDTAISNVNLSTDRDLWVPVWEKSLNKYPTPFLKSINLEDSAIIGFELPDEETCYLNKLGVPWINLSIHPLRFLDDLNFEVRTSFEFSQSEFATSRGLIDFFVQKMAASQIRDPQIKGEKTLLICGQDRIDKAIYFDNHFRTLDDYVDRIDDISRDFTKILYKPHPHYDSIATKQFLLERYNVEVVDENIYKMFCSGVIDAVCAISSSVIVEAPYFGVKSFFLEPRSRKYGPAVSYRNLLENKDFWLRGFLSYPSGSKYPNISSAVSDNHLRNIFGSWGFLSEEMHFRNHFLHEISCLKKAHLENQEALARAEKAEVKEINSQEQLTKALETMQQMQLGVQEALARAEKAEVKEINSQEQLTKALETMQQMQLGVQEALARAEQAEVKEINSQAQLTKALETMQKMQLGVQEALARAEQAEIDRLNAQDLLNQKNIEMADVVYKLSVVNEANHHHWLLTQELQKRIDAIFGSKSWRITAPLRWALIQFNFLKKYGLRVRVKALARKFYFKFDAYLLKKPNLKNSLLRYFRFLGIYSSLKILNYKFRNDCDGEVGKIQQCFLEGGDARGMSDRAIEIYNKLQKELRDKEGI